MLMKLLLTVVVVLGALSVLRLTGRAGTGRVPPTDRNKRVPEAEDLVQCAACGAYGPPGAPCRQCSDYPTP